MEEKDRMEVTVVDFTKVKSVLIKSKKQILLSCLIVGVLTAIIIVMVPRYYTSKVMLAPEEAGAGTGNSLSAIASSFGFDMGSMNSSDAIYPMLYPDLFESNDFIVDLFSIQVETLDGSVKTDYLDYLQHHLKAAPWQPIIWWLKELVKPKPRQVKKGTEKSGVNPFMLTEREDMIAEGVKASIKCSVDKKTNVITIDVTDQDPLICATLADSVRVRLQAFITHYRTNKSRADYEYYEKLVNEAKADYDKAVELYSEFCDSHRDVILQSYISDRDNLENDMQAKYDAYSAWTKQLLAARAKIQESTPAFTVLQNASVPIKPAGPKRMIIVAVMVFLAFIVSSAWQLKKIIKKEDADETD